MYLSILALPLLGAASAGLLGRKLGVTGAQIVTTVCMCSSALLSIVAFYEVALCGSSVSIYLSSWIDSGLMSVDWAFMFDSLTVSMLLPVTLVSSMVHIYSMSYMAADPHNQRFFSYLSMFTFFMLVLVAGDNYFILFLGWEGIGVSSYLLINFWFTRVQANKSAIKAMTVNRVGDMFLTIAFFGVFWAFGNLDYATVFSLSPYMNETVLTLIGLLFLLAAMGKSAQLGLHMWLPDAMEGPTPVSALIHAANRKHTILGIAIYSLPIVCPLLTGLILFHDLLPSTLHLCNYLLYILIIALVLWIICFLVIGWLTSPHLHSLTCFILLLTLLAFIVTQYVNLVFSVCVNTLSLINVNTPEYVMSFTALVPTNPSVEQKAMGNTHYIPWHITSAIEKAQATLTTFYDWVPQGTPHREFLDNHCVHLIKPAPHLNNMEHTGIPTHLFSKEYLLASDKLIDCAVLRSKTEVPDQGMIYAFINKETNRMYVGSSINMTSRLHTYIHSWETSRQRFLEEMRTTGGGFDNSLFVPNYEVPNYQLLFESLYPDVPQDPKMRYVLARFTEYHCRILEQAVIYYAKPEINDLSTTVSFTFPNVNIDTYTPNALDRAHPISVFTSDGQLYNKYESINIAKRALGISEQSLIWARNRADYLIYCPNPGQELRIFDHVINDVLQAPLNSHQKLMPISGVSLDTIPMGEIHAILDNKSDLYGVYDSCTQFAQDHDINSWQAYRYLNLNKSIPILGGSILVYLCCNPAYRQQMLDVQDKRTWPVVSIDTKQDNLVRYHDNPAAARIELSHLVGITDLKPTRNFTKDYITGTKRAGVIKFRRRFQLMWLKDYDPNV